MVSDDGVVVLKRLRSVDSSVSSFSSLCFVLSDPSSTAFLTKNAISFVPSLAFKSISSHSLIPNWSGVGISVREPGGKFDG